MDLIDRRPYYVYANTTTENSSGYNFLSDEDNVSPHKTTENHLGIHHGHIRWKVFESVFMRAACDFDKLCFGSFCRCYLLV